MKIQNSTQAQSRRTMLSIIHSIQPYFENYFFHYLSLMMVLVLAFITYQVRLADQPMPANEIKEFSKNECVKAAFHDWFIHTGNQPLLRFKARQFDKECKDKYVSQLASSINAKIANEQQSFLNSL